MSHDRWFEDYVPGAVRDLGSVVVDEQEVVAFAKHFDPHRYTAAILRNLQDRYHPFESSVPCLVVCQS